jgi:hypothetical protein
MVKEAKEAAAKEPPPKGRPEAEPRPAAVAVLPEGFREHTAARVLAQLLAAAGLGQAGGQLKQATALAVAAADALAEELAKAPGS